MKVRPERALLDGRPRPRRPSTRAASVVPGARKAKAASTNRLGRDPTLCSGDMTVHRMDNVLIVVDDLEAAKAFFAELGLELEGEAPLEGRWVDRVVGLNDVRADIAMMRTPDGHSRVELTKFHTPPAVRAEPESAPANTLGIRRIMFAVDDIDDVVARLRSHGAELVGEIAQYEDIYRLCFLRGPEGIIIGLAEQLSNQSVTDVLGNS
jgi:catechol 2,3-dioxygenase-like lactoylglutathione lyase family enzyme